MSLRNGGPQSLRAIIPVRIVPFLKGHLPLPLKIAIDPQDRRHHSVRLPDIKPPAASEDQLRTHGTVPHAQDQNLKTQK